MILLLNGFNIKQMPEMDGFEVCKYLKIQLEFKHIPIILITAKYGDAQSKIKGLELVIKKVLF